MNAAVSNLILLALGAVGLSISIPRAGWKTFVYYTILSNIVCAVSSLCLLLFGQAPWVTLLRYLATCMLAMTCLVTAFILFPSLGIKYAGLLFWLPTGIFVHVLCPILSFLSYVFLENHTGPSALFLPAAITLLYGLILLILNGKNRVDGPYPFFRVHDQSPLATVLWMAALSVLVTGISAGIWFIAH